MTEGLLQLLNCRGYAHGEDLNFVENVFGSLAVNIVKRVCYIKRSNVSTLYHFLK